MNLGLRASWANPAGFHVTVEFLGEIGENILEDVIPPRGRDHAYGVKKILKDVTPKYSAMNFYLDEVAAFPNKANPRVVNVRVGEEGRVGESFQNDLNKELRKIGLGQDSRLWKPHITLARNKNGEFINGLDSVKLKKVVWKVESVELIKSDLLPNGPRYTVLFSCNM